jgi:acyl-coenzyme A thioesterase 13
MTLEDEEKMKLLASLNSLYMDFDKNLTESMTPTYLNSKQGIFICDFKVGEKHCNGYNKLHGGAVASLVDLFGSYAFLATQSFTQVHTIIPGVSTDLNVSYFFGTDLGSVVVIDSRVLRRGKSLVFIQVNLRDKKTGMLLAQGRHTKAITQPKSKL